MTDPFFEPGFIEEGFIDLAAMLGNIAYARAEDRTADVEAEGRFVRVSAEGRMASAADPRTGTAI
jgi:hypothetical protein